MAPGALNRALAGALGLLLLAAPLAADFAAEEQARRARRVEENLWQLVFGKRAVSEARRLLGQPYLWGGKSGDKGFDCSGYTAYVYRRLGVPLAESAMQQFQQGSPVEKAGLEPGDLVFFLGQGSPLHVGIYEGDGRFLHAPGTGKVIESSEIDSSYFRDRFAGARRVSPALEEERRLRAEAASAPGVRPASAAPAAGARAPLFTSPRASTTTPTPTLEARP